MKAQGGFTLIEIMVVLLIIAGLAYIVGTNVMGRFSESKKEQTKIQIKNMESALKLFKLDNSFYPETQQGLDALIQQPSVGRETCCYARDGYLDSDQVPLDGWKSEFIYIGPDQTGDGTYEIMSLGEDAVEGTDDDISSRTIQ
jgi:general secretion pathway protein G